MQGRIVVLRRLAFGRAPRTGGRSIFSFLMSGRRKPSALALMRIASTLRRTRDAMSVLLTPFELSALSNRSSRSVQRLVRGMSCPPFFSALRWIPRLSA